MADKLDLLVSMSSDALQAEQKATESLSDRADKYLAAIGVILGLHIIEARPLSFSGHAGRTACSIGVVVGLGLLFVALLMTLMSMQPREFPTYPKSSDIQLLGTATTDEQAKRSVAKVYLDLRDGILTVNEKRAIRLTRTGIVLVLGFLVSVLGQLGLSLLQ